MVRRHDVKMQDSHKGSRQNASVPLWLERRSVNTQRPSRNARPVLSSVSDVTQVRAHCGTVFDVRLPASLVRTYIQVGLNQRVQSSGRGKKPPFVPVAQFWKRRHGMGGGQAPCPLVYQRTSDVDYFLSAPSQKRRR